MDTPYPFEKFSLCTELNIDPPERKPSWMLLARLGGDGGCWGVEVLWFSEGYAEPFGFWYMSVTHAFKTIPNVHSYF